MSNNLTHGMTVDEVDALGRLLQSKADQLHHLMSEVESALGRTIWEGPDAGAFKQQWWPDHRGRLQAVADQIHGFGQSALNNATEQRHASGIAVPGHSVGPLLGTTAPVLLPVVGSFPPSGGLDGYREHAGLHPSDQWWAQGPPANGMADQWGKAGNNCTSWVAYRRSQLGLDIPPGNGGAMGHDPNGAATPGAVVSYGSGQGDDFGHVMVVEESLGADKFRVSEMNYDNKGGFYEQRVWTRVPGTNNWHCELPYPETRALKFTL